MILQFGDWLTNWRTYGHTLVVVKSLSRLKNKKKGEKMKKVHPDPPPPVEKILNFFFFEWYKTFQSTLLTIDLVN